MGKVEVVHDDEEEEVFFGNLTTKECNRICTRMKLATSAPQPDSTAPIQVMEPLAIPRENSTDDMQSVEQQQQQHSKMPSASEAPSAIKAGEGLSHLDLPSTASSVVSAVVEPQRTVSGP